GRPREELTPEPTTDEPVVVVHEPVGLEKSGTGAPFPPTLGKLEAGDGIDEDPEVADRAVAGARSRGTVVNDEVWACLCPRRHGHGQQIGGDRRLLKLPVWSPDPASKAVTHAAPDGAERSGAARRHTRSSSDRVGVGGEERVPSVT